MFVPRRLVSSLLIPVFVALVSIAEAQTFRGGISGRVVDASGGVLPGVTVTATNSGHRPHAHDDDVGYRRFLDAGSAARRV